MSLRVSVACIEQKKSAIKTAGLGDPPPSLFWKHFCDLSRIPRGSRNEAKIRNHIIGIAARLGLVIRVDSTGNLVVEKPAFKGRSSAPIVVLQCHLDMVCEKEPGVEFDFETDPIRLIAEGDWLRAEGTTLGADNGVGIALCLAVIESRELCHGPLEVLFTVGEEIGLIGSHAITPEMVRGRMLVNLDSEDIGTFNVGCAGSRTTEICVPAEFEEGSRDGRHIKLTVRGLSGGHSGLDIHRGRANALKLLGRVLADAPNRQGLALSEIRGGSSPNSIPRHAEAVAIIPSKDIERLRQTVLSWESVFRAEYKGIEPHLALDMESTASGNRRVFARVFQEKVIHLLSALPHGVYSMEAFAPGLVKTSTNLAMIGLKDGCLTIGTKQRSSEDSEMQAIAGSISAIAALAGAQTQTSGVYPGWKPNPHSPLLRRSIAAYQRILGSGPTVASIHAGLECGLLAGKLDGLDAISVGATIRDAHSPGEKLQISSVKKLWDFVAGLLSDLAGPGSAAE